jgi:D-alanyl-D-alanine carboxypeptidase
MLEELESQLETSGVDKVDIMAVPGSDAGTMEQRFTGKFNRSIVAKTGTLNDTSAFSGYILNKVNTRFAVLNRTTPYADKTRTRKLQDNIVKEFIRKSGDTTKVIYSQSDYISLDDSIIFMN